VPVAFQACFGPRSTLEIEDDDDDDLEGGRRVPDNKTLRVKQLF